MHATTFKIGVTYVLTCLQGLKDIADSLFSDNGNRLITDGTVQDGTDMLDGLPMTPMRYELDFHFFYLHFHAAKTAYFLA